MNALREAPLDLGLGIAEEALRPATAPAEARGFGRDDVRLLLQDRDTGAYTHCRFRELTQVLRAGDLLVVNRSATLPASLPVEAAGGEPLRLHVAQRLSQGVYRVEARSEDGLRPARAIPNPADEFLLRDEGGRSLRLTVIARAHPASRQVVVRTQGRRSLLPWMRSMGSPIRYAYVLEPWPLAAYETIFAGSPGSAEMPSAARPFSPEVLAALKARGVRIAYLTLHCGLSSEEVEGSLQDHYIPPEPYLLPQATVREIARTKAEGGRVIAVGTTVVRTLQSACGAGGIRAGRGLAGAVVQPGTQLCAVDGLLTGLHTPRSSHLALLEAFLPAPKLREAYLDAIAEGYLWHEFGDMHLILPATAGPAMRYASVQE